jgi:uncharacterized protein YcbK (DUF882 family)
MSERLSQFITRDEYACSHCGSIPPDLFIHNIRPPYLTLFSMFDHIRSEWGRPIPISSGYRCPFHNAQVGGSAISIHMFGLALDCDCSDTAETEELHTLMVEMYPELRLGKYIHSGSFVHMDAGYVIEPRASHAWVRAMRWIK